MYVHLVPTKQNIQYLKTFRKSCADNDLKGMLSTNGNQNMTLNFGARMVL